MNYNNEKVRRQDRLLSESEALNLLKNGEYGILSMVSTENSGYGIPLNFVWDKKQSIYFHCAPEGEKLLNISANNNVSFCIVGRTKVISDKFTTAYQSVVLKGTATANIDDDERMEALELILDKYSPDDKEVGLMYAKKSFHRTAIIRMDITEFSGKTKVQ